MGIIKESNLTAIAGGGASSVFIDTIINVWDCTVNGNDSSCVEATREMLGDHAARLVEDTLTGAKIDQVIRQGYIDTGKTCQALPDWTGYGPNYGKK